MVHCSCPLYDLFVVVSGRDGRSSNYLRSRASDRSDCHETSIRGSSQIRITKEEYGRNSFIKGLQPLNPKNMSLKCVP